MGVSFILEALLFIVAFQNHPFSVLSGRKWSEKREVLQAAQFTDARGDLDLKISDKSVCKVRKMGWRDAETPRGLKKKEVI